MLILRIYFGELTKRKVEHGGVYKLHRFVYLGRNQAIDCDPEKFNRKQTGHGGMHVRL